MSAASIRSRRSNRANTPQNEPDPRQERVNRLVRSYKRGSGKLVNRRDRNRAILWKDGYYTNGRRNPPNIGEILPGKGICIKCLKNEIPLYSAIKVCEECGE